LQEFCNGKTLRSAVTKGYFAPERQPRRWRAIKQVLLDIAAGMEYVHSKGIVHGDLNPANVLLKVRPSRLLTCNCPATFMELLWPLSTTEQPIS
jgi:serine/threonine protein kinase